MKLPTIKKRKDFVLSNKFGCKIFNKNFILQKYNQNEQNRQKNRTKEQNKGPLCYCVSHFVTYSDCIEDNVNTEGKGKFVFPVHPGIYLISKYALGTMCLPLQPAAKIRPCAKTTTIPG